VLSESVLYTTAMVGLHQLWYKDFARSSFHFINDSREWLQMDKFGHTLTAYYVGKLGIEALRWAGVKDKRAIWYGGSLGLVFLTSVEVFDGFSAPWGASVGDVAANVTGAALLIGQELFWDEQHIKLKFSFTTSPYAAYRPELLGSNLSERILKDYNAQSYWLSFNGQLLNIEKWPAWLNIAIGYGADGMTGGHYNPDVNEAGMALPNFDRSRQFYFSPDVDLSQIKTSSKVLKFVLNSLNFIKIPAPAIEWNNKGIKLHGIYW